MLTLIAVAASGLVGCNGRPDGAAAKPQPATHTITMEAVSYKPEVVTAKVGDSIVWVNKDPFPHSVASKASGFDSLPIQPDRSWTLTPSAPGELSYVCTLHPTMKGTIRVE